MVLLVDSSAWIFEAFVVQFADFVVRFVVHQLGSQTRVLCTGPVTNLHSIWLAFTIRCNKVCILYKHWIKVYVSCFLRCPKTAEPSAPPCISVVPEATLEASWRPLKCALSAQKVIQEFETETRELLGGAKEISVLLDEGSLIGPLSK